uniref:Telomeric repeat binding factor 2 n=1 Tax=Buteo japonicus TaxID=224669 RepID=A0A8B9YXG0_9AVES
MTSELIGRCTSPCVPRLLSERGPRAGGASSPRQEPSSMPTMGGGWVPSPEGPCLQLIPLPAINSPASLLVRPLEKEPMVAQMLRMMQLLSRIEEGENLDCTFDKEAELTPLESAISILELIQREFSVAEKTMETVEKMVKEAAVIVCIKNGEFDKASKIVKRHIGKEPRNQKKRNELLTVIREKNFTHPVVKNFSYKNFQQSVFQFLKTYVDNSEPLLLTIMKKTLNSEHAKVGKHSSVTPESFCLFCRQPSGTVTTYGISVLREAFKILSDSQDSDALFTKLDETDFSFPKQLSQVHLVEQIKLSFPTLE